jgi:hypothetical protein
MKMTDKAAEQLAVLANANTSARKYVSEHLPALIDKTSSGEIWLNAVRLAGELKILEAVPALTASMERTSPGGL